jgi:hypothetical protein
MEAVLITRADSDEEGGKSVHIYRFDGGAWSFVSHGDPGLDYVVKPDGRTLEVFTPWGDKPEGVPDQLWTQFMTDIGAIL